MQTTDPAVLNEHQVGGSGAMRGSDLFLPLHTGRLSESVVLLVDLWHVLRKELIGKLVGVVLELKEVASLRPQAVVEQVVGVVLFPG